MRQTAGPRQRHGRSGTPGSSKDTPHLIQHTSSPYAVAALPSCFTDIAPFHISATGQRVGRSTAHAVGYML